MAFNNCHKLTDVVLPSDLTSIGRCAFYACEKLDTINIPSSVVRIGDNAFSGCSNLVSAHFGQTEGWIADEIIVDGTLLSNPERAAEYLTLEYNLYIWIRN